MRNRFKVKGAYFTIQLLMALILFGFFAIVGVFSGNDLLDSYKASLIEREGEALDQALRIYSMDHTTSYPTGKIDSNGLPITKTYGIYPESVDELDYQVRYGFISALMSNHVWDWNEHSFDSLPGDFYYEVSADKRAYLLQAKLPNGYIYTTPGSLYSIKELEGNSVLGDKISSSENEWGSSISGKSKN